jgi:predicted amidophosphoribosyltransferase
MFCSNCGAKNEGGGKFCGNCGFLAVSQSADAPQGDSLIEDVSDIENSGVDAVIASTPRQYFCNQCGNVIDKDGDFCGNCGVSTAGMAEGRSNVGFAPATLQPKTGKSRNKVMAPQLSGADTDY